jgi:copper chaperone
MESTTIGVRGMTCGGCAASVERVLRELAGVSKVEVSLANEQATVEFDAGRVTVDDLRAAIEDAGYDAA